MDCVKVLRRMMRMACERLKRDQQSTALVRWRRKPCSMRGTIGDSYQLSRKVQLGLALQIFWARVKVAVRGDKRKHLQEDLDRAAEAADNGHVDEVYKLLKTGWSSPRKEPSEHQAGTMAQWARTPGEAAGQWRLQYEATFKGQVTTCAKLAASGEKRAAGREPCWGIVPTMVGEVLDLILSVQRAKRLARMGSRRSCLGLAGRMAQLMQPLFAGVCVCLQGALPIVWKEASWQAFRVERTKREDSC